jgi:Nif-specific regulatory protein
MGEVFLVEDLAEARLCALKRLKRAGRSQVAALSEEFQALTRLRHPSIVAVYDFGIDPDGVPFYTMEYVPGRGPLEVVTSGDWHALLTVGAEIAHGLDVLHARGIIHGDLKPSNILVLGDGPGNPIAGIRLVDFGLAAAIGGDGRRHRGTSGFTAPEVIEGGRASVGSDLYGLGATLFLLACSQQPFEGPSAEAVLRRQLTASPDRRPLDERGAPRPLTELILQLLATDPRLRPQSAREVRRELESIDPTVRRSLEERLGSASLVGRERELGKLEEYIGRRLSRSRMVVVSGPGGIGKTALLSEIARRAALQGHPVVWHAHATLGPIHGASRKLVARPPETLDQILDLEVIRLAEGQGERHVLHVVDDEQDLDLLSRQLLRRALLYSKPTLWLAARDTSGAPPEDARALAGAGLIEVLTLGPLTEEGVSQLIAARLREPAPQRLSAFLFEATHGHPESIVRGLKELSRSGALREDDAGVVVDIEVLDRIRIPFAADSDTRVAALPESTRCALEVLSVIGRAPAEELRRIAPDVNWEVLPALQQAGLVRCGPDGWLRCSWAPDQLHLGEDQVQGLHRAALTVSDLLPAERFHHLSAIGDRAGALEAADEALRVAPDPALVRAAAQLAESEGPAAAATWHERTGRELMRHGRYEAAIPHLEQAVTCDPSDQRHTERLYQLSNAHLHRGDTAAVAEAVAQALAERPLPGLRSRLLTNDSARLHLGGHLDRALEVARCALAGAKEAGDAEAEGAAAQSLVHIHLARGDFAEATTMAEVGVAATERAGTAFGRVRAIGSRAAVALAQQQPEQALTHYQTALELARSSGIRSLVEELLIGQGMPLCDLGRWNEVRVANAEALRLALEDHRPRNAAVAMVNLAHADALTGRPRLSRQFIPHVESCGWRALAQAQRASGQLKAAWQAGRRAVQLALVRGSADEIGWCRLEYGRDCAARSSWEEAVEVWRTALDDLPSGPPGLTSFLVANLGEAAIRLGRMDEAGVEVERLERMASRSPLSPHPRGFMLRLKALLALARGDMEQGLRAGGEALEALAQIPAPADRADTILVLAERVVATPVGTPPMIHEWLKDAAAAYERLGNDRGRERALQCSVALYRRQSEMPGSGRSRRALFEAVSELVTSMSDLRELAERAMTLVVQELAAERGVFLAADPDSDALTPLAQRGGLAGTNSGEALEYSRKVVARVATSARSLLVTDAPLDPRAASHSVERLRLRSILCTPLLAGERVVGAVYLDDARRPRAFDEADQELLESIAQLLAAAVDRSLGQKEMEQTNELLIGENRSLRREVVTRFRSEKLIGESSALRRIVPLIERASAINTTVLLLGESGTGKELIAHVIHSNSKRRNKPFVAVNCAALTDSLLESELFGIDREVATGVRRRQGYFRQADGGILFLDEVGDMPLRHQAALLSVISNREVTPVGGGPMFPVNIQVIAATNRDLRNMVREGSFRQELYYRVNVFPIEIPPLRDRKADIPALARHLVQQIAAGQGRAVPQMSREFMTALMSSHWPGNIREFQNYIEMVMAATPGSVLYPKPLPEDLAQRSSPPTHGRLTEQLEGLERRALIDALERAEGNQSRAARELGITEASMRRRMAKFGLSAMRRKRRGPPKRRPRK